MRRRTRVVVCLVSGIASVATGVLVVGFGEGWVVASSVAPIEVVWFLHATGQALWTLGALMIAVAAHAWINSPSADR